MLTWLTSWYGNICWLAQQNISIKYSKYPMKSNNKVTKAMLAAPCPFSHAMTHLWLIMSIKEDTDSAWTDKSEQHSAAAARCSTDLFRPSSGKEKNMHICFILQFIPMHDLVSVSTVSLLLSVLLWLRRMPCVALKLSHDSMILGLYVF